MAKRRQPASQADLPVSGQASKPQEVVEPSEMIVANPSTINNTPVNQGLTLTGMGDEEKSFWTNVSKSDPKFPIIVMRCLGECKYDSDSMLNQTFFMRYLFCHAVELLDQSNAEFIKLPRCVAINPEGETLKFVSVGAYDSLQWLVRTFGPGPWFPPVPFKVKRQNTRQGFKVIRLEIDETQPLPAIAQFQANK